MVGAAVGDDCADIVASTTTSNRCAVIAIAIAIALISPPLTGSQSLE
jgi:hypothetical protein